MGNRRGPLVYHANWLCRNTPCGNPATTGYHVQVQPEVLWNSILEHTLQDGQEDLLQLLLQFPTILKSSPKSTSQLPHDDRPVNKREPFEQKQGKIPQAHCPVIEETLDSWIRLGLIHKADSMFNTVLLRLQHPDGYRIVLAL